MLSGHIDLVSHDRISGWARDPDAPGCRVRLSVLVDGTPALRVDADTYRADLETAGIGDGAHGFDAAFVPPLAAGPHVITLCHDAGEPVLNSPLILWPRTD